MSLRRQRPLEAGVGEPALHIQSHRRYPYMCARLGNRDDAFVLFKQNPRNICMRDEASTLIKDKPVYEYANRG